MANFNGIIHKVEQMKNGTYRVTIVRPEHINPPAIQATFLIEDVSVIDFFNRNIGWPVYGGIDSFGYMDTCSHAW